MTTRGPRVVKLVPHFDRIGGYERQALSLGRAMVRRGIGVWIVTDNYQHLPPREHREGVVVWRLSAPHCPFWLQPRRRGTPPDRASDLAVFLRQHRARYEVVHAHAFCPPCDVGMATARALGKRALVKVATEGDPTEIAHGDARMQAIWRGLSRADRFLCISRAIVDEFRGLGVPETQLAHVWNGVDTDLYRPPTTPERRAARAALGLAGDGCVLATVGRLARRKGVDVLLRAWSLVPRHRRRGATLLVIGEGEEGGALRALAATLALDASVRFLGEREDVPALLHACDAFVFPSRREGLPNALLEAMAAGLAPIATRIGGNVDVVTPEVDGLLCASDDALALAAAIERLLDDARLRRRLGETARQRVLATYAFDVVIDRLLPLYGVEAPARPTGAAHAA